jgi:enoyl-CoA hydratase/carnithine racemase
MAMELLTIDAPISARRLHQLGLCHAVIPDDDVFSAALSHARKLSESSTEALAVVKGGLNRNRLTAINEALEAEKEACLMTFSTSEVLDAVAAQVRRMHRRSTG